MIVRPSFPRLSHLAVQSPSCQYPIQNVFTRQTPRGINIPFRQTFSSRSALNQDHKPVNHYEILGVKTNATKAELKRQFYKLSKETHPDLHKNDPTASDRFSQISESYSILVDEEKRRRYDRDFMRQNHGAPAGQSGTYAGSRPASGLSKRRGTFRGAPQSFYSHGGYGTSGRQSQSAEQPQHKAGTFNASAYTERGQYDPDFDSDPIFRTQNAEDARRSRRMQAAIDMEQAQLERGSDSFWLRFIIVTTIVVAGVSVGTILVSMRNAPRGGLTRADGSRRDGPRNEWAKG